MITMLIIHSGPVYIPVVLCQWNIVTSHLDVAPIFAENPLDTEIYICTQISHSHTAQLIELIG